MPFDPRLDGRPGSSFAHSVPQTHEGPKYRPFVGLIRPHLPSGFFPEDGGTRRQMSEAAEADGTGLFIEQERDEEAWSLSSAMSREMVRLYKTQFGRGPTKASTKFAGPDIVICTLEDSFTPAEEKLVAMGEHQRMRDVRTFFQHATE